jgi:FMN phosphatase YigB (HAD superfamily)
MRRAYLMEKFGDKFEAVEIAFLMDKKAAVLAGMISKYGMDPGSTAFLDDMPANAVGGRRLGLVAIHMKTGFNIDVPFEFRDIPAVGSMDEFVRLISALDGNPQPRSSISGESARLLAGRSMGTAR